MGRKKNEKNYPINFKHEVCQYYEHHTQKETIELYGVSAVSIWKWRMALGYRNKHRGHCVKPSQSVAQVKQHRSFMVTRNENGELKAKVADLEYKLSAMEYGCHTNPEWIVGRNQINTGGI